MEFEFDSGKSEGNRAKHGIDFVEAQAVWLDRNRLDLSGRITPGEVRTVSVGKIKERLFAVCWTDRGEVIRIISARVAREGERRLYEQA